MQASILLLLYGLVLPLITAKQLTPIGFGLKVTYHHDVWNPELDKASIRKCLSGDPEETLLGRLSFDSPERDCGTRSWTISSEMNLWKNADHCIVSLRECLEKAVDEGWSGAQCYAEKGFAGCTLRYAPSLERMSTLDDPEESKENNKYAIIKRARLCHQDPSTC